MVTIHLRHRSMLNAKVRPKGAAVRSHVLLQVNRLQWWYVGNGNSIITAKKTTKSSWLVVNSTLCDNGRCLYGKAYITGKIGLSCNV